MTPPGFHHQPCPGSGRPRRLAVLGLMTILAVLLPMAASAGPDLPGERITGFDIAGVTLRMTDRDVDARLGNGSGWIRQSVDRQPCQQPKPPAPPPTAAGKPASGTAANSATTGAAGTNTASTTPPAATNEPPTCARTMSFLRENGGTMEGLAVDLVEDVDQPVGTTSVWRIRYRAGGITEFNPGSFLQHATAKYGPFTLANVEGSFFWGIAIPAPAGPPVAVDRSKPYLMVSPIRFQVVAEDEGYQRQRTDALAIRLRDVRDLDNRTQASQRPGRPGF